MFSRKYASVLSIFALGVLISGSLQCLAVVTSEKPDLSLFKLRHVNVKELARARAGRQIKDLATGAITMHESLIVDVSYVKCPAYAHLFKLIKNQAHLEDPQPPVAVRQNVIESLAIVAVADRIFYHDLFLRSIDKVSAEHYSEAIKLLEAQQDTSGARDAWLDLIECMSIYMKNNGLAKEVLSQSDRQKAVASMSAFKSVPVDVAQIPTNLVVNLAKWFESLTSGAKSHVEILTLAEELIESLDDNETREARRQFKQNPPKDAMAQLEEKQANENAHKNVPTEPEEITSVETPKNVELVVANVEDDNQQATHEFTENQLAILLFIKMRLEKKPLIRFESAPRLRLELAFDFSSHWDDLKRSKLDETSRFGAHALEFLQDPVNSKLAERVNLAIENYAKITALVALMRSRNTYKSLAEFREPFEQLDHLLDVMDPAFDIDDLRRLHAVWRAKYIELNTLDRFINNEW